MTQTGGGPLDTTPLTPLEEKLIGFMGRKGVEGDSGILELGVPTRAPVTPVPATFQNVIMKFIKVQRVQILCFVAPLYVVIYV